MTCVCVCWLAECWRWHCQRFGHCIGQAHWLGQAHCIGQAHWLGQAHCIGQAHWLRQMAWLCDDGDRRRIISKQKQTSAKTRRKNIAKKEGISSTSATGFVDDCFSQSDAYQLRRQSLQCSWTSSLELSAAGPQTP